MRTAWKAIATLSRMCVHCCKGLSASRFPYAPGIQQELDERKSWTDGPARPPGSGDDADLGQRFSGTLLLQIAHLVSGAALTHGARLAAKEEKVRLHCRKLVTIPWCPVVACRDFRATTPLWSRCAIMSVIVSGRPARR